VADQVSLQEIIFAATDHVLHFVFNIFTKKFTLDYIPNKNRQASWEE